MSKVRQQFRPIPSIQEIHVTENKDPAFMYKNVIMTYKFDPGRVQRYLQAGWEIVETTDPNKDDRDFSAASKEKKLRPQMLVETTNDGHEQILMRILKTKWEENQAEKKRIREDARVAEARRRGDRIIRRGNEVITHGTQLSE